MASEKGLGNSRSVGVKVESACSLEGENSSALTTGCNWGVNGRMILWQEHCKSDGRRGS